jgi:hypothetical protein
MCVKRLHAYLILVNKLIIVLACPECAAYSTGLLFAALPTNELGNEFFRCYSSCNPNVLLC